MKKFLFVFALMMGAFISTSTQAQEATTPQAEDAPVEETTSDKVLYQTPEGEMIETDKPIFQFEEEVHDFGELEEGPKYEYVFEFTNIGKSPLNITGVKASCGCTTPTWPKEPVMPGEVSTIKVIYNSKGRPNKFNKAITITSNAITPTKRLYIKGDVKAATIDTPVKTKSIIENNDGE